MVGTVARETRFLEEKEGFQLSLFDTAFVCSCCVKAFSPSRLHPHSCSCMTLAVHQLSAWGVLSGCANLLREGQPQTQEQTIPTALRAEVPLYGVTDHL